MYTIAYKNTRCLNTVQINYSLFIHMLLFLPYVGSSSLTEQHLILVVKTKFEHSFSSASLIDGNCLHSRGQEQQQAKDLSENTSTFFK